MDASQISGTVSVHSQSKPMLRLSPPSQLCFEECFSLQGHVISLSCRNTISAKKSPMKTQRSAFVAAMGPNWNDSALSLNRISLHWFTIRQRFCLSSQEFANSGVFDFHNREVCHRCLSCIFRLQLYIYELLYFPSKWNLVNLSIVHCRLVSVLSVCSVLVLGYQCCFLFIR